MVPPGTYRVRLSAGETSVERDLELRIDPRVAAEGVTVADLEAQYGFSLAVRATITEARGVASGLDELRKTVEQARAEARASEKREPAELVGALDRLEASLRDAGGSYPQPMLLSQLNYLLGMVSRADQAPGDDAYARHEELKREVEAARGALEALERRARGAA